MLAVSSWGSNTPMAALAGESSPDAFVDARLRAGGVVLRRSADGANPEVLLVSRRRAPDMYTVPAGKFEEEVDGDSFEACALRETQEEAGVECSIRFDLGWYKGLSKDNHETRTRFYAMAFVRELPNWSEESERARSWRAVAEAQRLTKYNPVLAQVFRQLVEDLAAHKDGNLDLWAPDAAPADSVNMRRSTSATSISSDDSESLGIALPEAETVEGTAPAVPEPPTPVATALDARGDLQPLERYAELARSVSTDSGGRRASVEEAVIRTRSNSQRKLSIEEFPSVHIEDVDGERFCFYGNQVGGHFCLVKPAPENNRITVKGASGGEQLQLDAHKVVLKPLEKREHSFYVRILTEVPAFLPHMAQLFGTKTLTHRQVSAMTAEVDKCVSNEDNFLEERKRSHQFQTYIVLEDLASSMKMPRILDLKIGFKQRSKHHSERKRERCRMKAATSTSHALGFRICGFQTETQTHDKYWGRKLMVSGMRDALAEFFLHELATEAERTCLITGFLRGVCGLRELAEKMPQWRFWSSSLLFLFDGKEPGAEPVVRLIDYAHCTRITTGSVPDSEFIAGLRNVEVFLEAIRDGHGYDPWIHQRLAGAPDVGLQDAEEEAASESDWGREVSGSGRLGSDVVPAEAGA
mmetsp:Transcript_73750/g.171030  ORF Transcript_73750/g.171030 Transcript_73750/m.171030 type:complete len:639 (+) Transcript_73750:75-1991(+)|eukprot:CAMPEP_0171103900 /NCGR_PEP_ID=MMETSP0766_2-20121228/59613_1 /TAXON_ID=439317 /ORGANISM="Gambierdiscus australes, Strain CAWD 149" /LENGTH=638 /DNA_ID=CAMNT_0011564413 /DNA_START=73 /DNA_END=1989 /DNA_ORIENTATION=-